MKKMSLVSWIVGIIVMAATASVWWLAFHDYSGYPMAWLGFGVVLGLELVTTLLFSVTREDPRLVARAVVFLLETILMAMVSVLFLQVNALRFGYEGYIIVLISTVAVCLVSGVWLTQNYSQTTKAQSRVQAAQEYLWRCREVVSIMQCYEHAGQYREQLDRLEEDLRYSFAISTQLDEQLHRQLCVLAEQIRTDGPDAGKLFEEVRHLIRRRKELAKR